jgi:hypothetical protein
MLLKPIEYALRELDTGSPGPMIIVRVSPFAVSEELFLLAFDGMTCMMAVCWIVGSGTMRF